MNMYILQQNQSRVRRENMHAVVCVVAAVLKNKTERDQQDDTVATSSTETISALQKTPGLRWAMVPDIETKLWSIRFHNIRDVQHFGIHGRRVVLFFSFQNVSQHSQ